MRNQIASRIGFLGLSVTIVTGIKNVLVILKIVKLHYFS